MRSLTLHLIIHFMIVESCYFPSFPSVTDIFRIFLKSSVDKRKLYYKDFSSPYNSISLGFPVSPHEEIHLPTVSEYWLLCFASLLPTTFPLPARITF